MCLQINYLRLSGRCEVHIYLFTITKNKRWGKLLKSINADFWPKMEFLKK